MRLRIAVVGTLIATLLGASAWMSPAGAAGGTISGTAFQDLDRDGVRDAGEAAFEGHRIYAYDATGASVGNALTDGTGQYRISVPAAGTYRIRLGSASWWGIWLDWAPTTTNGLLQPVRYAEAGATNVDFGWRRIVRSTDSAAPLSSFTGPSGLTVHSYNDVVSAATIHDAVAQGAVGAEAATTVIRFDLGTSDITSTTISGSPGSYNSFSARVYVTYESWLSGQSTLSHEYGHAWTLHKAYTVEQDPTLARYLEIRGLTGDSRLGSSHAWTAREMIAEDYRQLLGPPAARSATQENRDIAEAEVVPGLYDYLAGEFSTPRTQEPAPQPEPAPVVAPPSVANLGVNPDPVATVGRISGDLSASADVSVVIVDDAGKVVRKLMTASPKQAGTFSVDWDRKDDRGRKVRRGTFTAVVTSTNSSGSTSASDTFTTT